MPLSYLPLELLVGLTTPAELSPEDFLPLWSLTSKAGGLFVGLKELCDMWRSCQRGQ